VPELAQMLAGWPFAASLAAAVAARGLRGGRRRAALNEAVHELRRPLQAIALAAPPAGDPAAAELDLSLRMASAALERLEREINGAVAAPRRERLATAVLLEEAARRWRRRAAQRGGWLELRRAGAPPEIEGDRDRLAQALDNLIANSLEHGGPRIELSARAAGDRLALYVADSGGDAAASRRRARAGLGGRLGARGRRGHGLRIVRRIAVEHGGRFELRRSGSRTEAVLELPLAEDGQRP
jgi:hypothetical protein